MSGRRLRWHELVGRKVIDCDGARVARVVDIIVTPDGDQLRISGLLVGRWALLRRVAMGTWADRFGPRTEVPWDSIAEVGAVISLNVAGGTLPAESRAQGRIR